MWIYFAFSIIMLFLAVLIDFVRWQGKERWRVVVGASLPIAAALFFGLRDPTIGLDSITYIDIFYSFANYRLGLEPGYRIFVLLNRLFFEGNVAAFLIVTSLSLNLLFYWGYALLTPRPAITFAIFFCTFMNYQIHLNIVRQGFAAGFLLVAIGYKLRGRLAPMLMAYSFGLMFHTSLLLVAPVLMLSRKVPRLTVIIATALASFYLMSFFDMISIVEHLSPKHWAGQKFRDYFVATSIPPAGLKIQYIFIFAFALLLSLLLSRIRSEVAGFWVQFMLVTLLLVSLFNRSLAVADRTAYYLYCFLPVTFAFFWEHVKPRRWALGFGLIFASIWSFKSVYLQGRKWFVAPYTINASLDSRQEKNARP